MPPGKKNTDDGASSEKASGEVKKRKPKTSLKKLAKTLVKKVTKKATAKKVAKKAVAKKVTKKAVAKKAVTKKTDTKVKAETKKTTTKKASTKKTGEESVEESGSTTSKKSSGRRGSRRGSSKKTATKKDETKKGSEKESGEKKDEAGGSEEGGEKKPRRGQGDKSKSGRSGRGPQRRSGRRTSIALPEATTGPAPKDRIMLVNEITNEECRIAMIENGRIDEYFVERASSETVVGNIYKARVTNIEPAIQAAFVDFGLGESGFLHVSDLHPKYFPGSEMVEEVGKKIPRRQRPPIQDALKKGQEILVQVLKQGVGTKGRLLGSKRCLPTRSSNIDNDRETLGCDLPSAFAPSVKQP